MLLCPKRTSIYILMKKAIYKIPANINILSRSFLYTKENVSPSATRRLLRSAAELAAGKWYCPNDVDTLQIRTVTLRTHLSAAATKRFGVDNETCRRIPVDVLGFCCPCSSLTNHLLSLCCYHHQKILTQSHRNPSKYAVSEGQQHATLMPFK